MIVAALIIALTALDPDAVAADDMQRLAEQPASVERAHAYATLVRSDISRDLAAVAYNAMIHDYTAVLRRDDKADPSLDAMITDPMTARRFPEITTEICLELANHRVTIPTAEHCLDNLTGFPDSPIIIASIRGFTRYTQHDYAGALSELESVSGQISMNRDPALHARIAASLVATGKVGDGCAKALRLATAQSLHPDVIAVIATCSKRQKDFKKKLAIAEQEERALVLERKVDGPAFAALPLETLERDPATLAVGGAPSIVTVVFFFSVDVVQCQAQIPKLAAFASAIAADAKLNGLVRVVGIHAGDDPDRIRVVRSLVKNEFPVFLDGTGASIQTMQRLGLEPAVPLFVIADDKGRMRYEIPTSGWRDTKRDLLWATTSLLP